MSKTKKKRIRSILKTHGGKGRLIDFILDEFPNNYTRLNYAEPFIGGGSIFLNKEKSPTEIINDLDSKTYYVWRALRYHPIVFLDLLNKIQYNEVNFNFFKTNKFMTLVDMAVQEVVLRRFSRGGMKKDFAWSQRLRGGKPGDENSWLTILSQLPIIVERCKRVAALNRKATNVLEMYNSADWFFYHDPPYLQSTRSAKQVYEHEMIEKDHEDFLDVVIQHKAKHLISGYNSDLYNRKLHNWNKIEKSVTNNSGQNSRKQKRTEVLWKNY